MASSKQRALKNSEMPHPGILTVTFVSISFLLAYVILSTLYRKRKSFTEHSLMVACGVFSLTAYDGDTQIRIYMHRPGDFCSGYKSRAHRRIIERHGEFLFLSDFKHAFLTSYR